jgi:hypothetical protein
LQPISPQYTYKANKDGSKTIFQTPSSQSFQPRNSLKKVYNIENTNLGADEKLADEILARLAPSVETNVKNLLGKNYGALGGNTAKAKSIYKAGQSTNPLKTYSFGINKPTENNEKIIDTVIKQLSPQIEDSVSSIFNVAEDINHPDLGKVIRRTQDQSDNLKVPNPVYKYSFANPDADEKLADEILARLAPSVETNVKNLLGNNYGTFGGNTPKTKSIYTYGQSTNPFQTYSFGTNNLEGQSTNPSKTYSSGINKPTKNNEKIIDAVIKQLSPQIEDSVSSIFNVAEDINHPSFFFCIILPKAGWFISSATLKIEETESSI